MSERVSAEQPPSTWWLLSRSMVTRQTRLVVACSAIAQRVLMGISGVDIMDRSCKQTLNLAVIPSN